MIPAALLPIFTVLVGAPTGPDDACPSARQVTEAMQARFPAFVLSPSENQSPGRSDVLRALLDVAADGTVVRFSLVDARGDTQLRRTLPAPGRGRPVADCLALADTLAAIVERYLGGIAYEAPEAVLPDPPAAPPVTATGAAPPAPAPPIAPLRRAKLVLVGLAWRMPSGQGADGEVEGRLGGEFELTQSTPRLAALVSIGASPGVQAAFTWNGEEYSATLRRFPARLGVLLNLPAGPGWVQPAAVVGVDLLVGSAGAVSGEPASNSVRFGPGLEALVGYRLRIAGPFHLRARAAIGFAIKRYLIDVQDGPLVFSTPRAYASFGIDTGVLFQ